LIALCLDCTVETPSVKLNLELLRQRHNVFERHVISGIEIDRGGVSIRQARHARLPRMYRNRPDLHGIEQRQQVAADDSLCPRAVPRGDARRPNALRHVRSGVLLEK
jgi:hypothetical protein